MTKYNLTNLAFVTLFCLVQSGSCESSDMKTMFCKSLNQLFHTGVSKFWQSSVKYLNSESCSDKFIEFNERGLEDDLKFNLHGQHLVQKTVLPALKSHFRAKNSANKALVLSFHGLTGSGKTFVSKIIAKHLYKRGLDSEFVHHFITSKHFPLESKIDDYKIQLQEKIEKAVAKCARSLFIFDEIDKMPKTLLDIITPYVGFHENIDGLDYRQSVFIFLSNAGETNITNFAYQWWKDGKEREDISLKDVEGLVSRNIFINEHLTNVFVPFFPLEKQHVKWCIQDALWTKGKRVTETRKFVEDLANEMEYFPSDVKLFSKSGCKRVSQIVGFCLEAKKIIY